MSWLQIRAKRERIEKLTQDSRQILDLAEAEKREPTDEENGRFAEMHAEAEGLRTVIESLEKQMELESFANDTSNRSVDNAGREDTNGSEQNGQSRSDEGQKKFQRDCNVQYIRGGIRSLNQEQREFMETLEASLSPEQRAMGVGSDPAGGYLVIDEAFSGRLEQAMLQFGGMERAGSTVITTSTGANLPMPTSDDTGNTGSRLGENTAASTTDVTVGEVVLGEYTYTSDLVPVSRQLMQDSAWPVDTWLAGLLGERVARKMNAEFTTNTSGSGPKGLLQSTTLGKTAAAVGAITYDEILDLKHSVNPSYRESPAAGFMWNDSTLLAVKKLQNGTGDYLWRSGVATGEPPTFDGDRYTVNQSFSDIATGVKSVVYGDFSKYYIRRIASPIMLRLDERYAEKFQVAFILFVRADGTLVDAGTNPLKHLIQA